MHVCNMSYIAVYNVRRGRNSFGKSTYLLICKFIYVSISEVNSQMESIFVASYRLLDLPLIIYALRITDSVVITILRIEFTAHYAIIATSVSLHQQYQWRYCIVVSIALHQSKLLSIHSHNCCLYCSFDKAEIARVIAYFNFSYTTLVFYTI